ncbi:MAG: exo-alpha-sialidase [Candidatus Aminicenantes bacterium]|nr:MAG: exo-alpha-sialidase [Candidatus Aminicenantes bacterium]
MKRKNFIFPMLLIFILFQCCSPTGSDGDGSNEQNNQTLRLTSISPTSKVAHMPTFTLTARGTKFVSGSKIVFNGTEKQTTYVSAAELICQIEPDDTVLNSAVTSDTMGISRILSETVTVFVRNPSSEGGDSNSLNFTIESNHTFYETMDISGDLEHACPAITTDSTGNIYVVCNDTPFGTREVYFICSTDDGESWNQPANISNNLRDSAFPAIAVDTAGNINVVWSDDTPGIYDTYFIRSTDNGNSWCQPVNISNNSGNSWSSTIAVDNAGNINAAWFDDTSGDWQIYFSRSTDNGVNWSQPVTIANINDFDGESSIPIAVDSAGNIYAAWYDDEEGPTGEEIFFSRSTDNGNTWSQPVNISNNSEYSENPAIAVDNADGINIVWSGATPDYNYDIYFSRSTDHGVNWNPPVNISNNPEYSTEPDFAIDSAGNINVVWTNVSSSPPYEEMIYFSRSIDNGITWNQVENISNNNTDSWRPCIAVDSLGNVNVACNCGKEVIHFTRSTR